MFLLFIAQSLAENPWEDASYQDLYEYARALSLDIRADVLSKEELQDIESAGSLSDEIIESWLYSEYKANIG